MKYTALTLSLAVFFAVLGTTPCLARKKSKDNPTQQAAFCKNDENTTRKINQLNSAIIPYRQAKNGPMQDFTFTEDIQAAGFSPERLSRVDSLLERYVREGKAPNAVAIIGRGGKIFYQKAFGRKDETGGQKVAADDIFRIASMSKGIVSVGLMTLFEQGKFLLDEPVSMYIPEFKNSQVVLPSKKGDTEFKTRAAKREITIRHLLCHSSGIPYQTPFNAASGIPYTSTMDDVTIGEVVKKLAKLPLAHDPGEKYTYGMSIDVAGYLIEVLSGKPLDIFMKERIFEPLGMDDTYFYLPDDKKERLVTLFAQDKNGTLVPSANKVQQDFPVAGPQKCFLGGAGLCSTAMDYAKFCQMLLNEGSFNNHSILSPKTVQMTTTLNQLAGNQNPSTDFQFGLGFQIHSPWDAAHTLSGIGAYGWAGMYGTYYRIDPKEKLFFILMSNAFPWSERDTIKEYFQVAVYQALEN